MSNDLVRPAAELTRQDIQKNLKNDAKYLVKKAEWFIKQIQIITQEIEHKEKFFDKPLAYVGEVFLKNRTALQKAVEQQYLFEQAVNNFLGRKIHFAWIDVKTGEIYFTDEISAIDIYKTADVQSKGNKTSSYTGKVYRSNVLNNVGQEINFLEGQFKERVNNRVAQHQMLLKTIFARWRQNQDKKNPYYKEHKDTVYWEDAPKGVIRKYNKTRTRLWNWSTKMNRGYISQEFVNFIFNDTIVYGLTEWDIGSFMMRNELPEKKNAIPGIVKGDIIVRDTNDTVQIAVKSGQFDTASIGPYLRVAFQIIDLYYNLNSLTVDNVQEILKSLAPNGKYSQTVTEKGRKKAEEIIQNILPKNSKFFLYL